MSTFIYRKNGREVFGTTDGLVTLDGVTYLQPQTVNTKYYDMVVDPPTPDGEDLAVPKVWDDTSVRNATVEEQLAFATYEAEDQIQLARDSAIASVVNDPDLNKVLNSIVHYVVTEVNLLRGNPTTQFEAQDEMAVRASILDGIANGDFD